MSSREVRNLSIPEGLNQERVDAALSRLLGLSRNVIVGLIESGEISKLGKPIGKSDRVITGDQIEVLRPAAKGEAKLVATPIDGLKVVYDDEYLIVINKPVGIAAHPSPGWKGATVVGAILVMMLIFIWLTRKQLVLGSGDVWQSVWSSIVKLGLKNLDKKSTHKRNWNPNILLFSGGTETRKHLIDFSKTVAGAKGMISNFDFPFKIPLSTISSLISNLKFLSANHFSLSKSCCGS